MRILWAVAILAACGHGQTPPGSGDDDAPPPFDGGFDPRPDAEPSVGMARSHTLFLNTEGATITQGPDDAVANKSSIPANPSSTLAKFLATDGNRLTRIDDLVVSLVTILGPFGIEITTARPAAGPFDMVVLTDSASTALGLANGVAAVTPTSCNSIDSVVSFIFPPFAADSSDRNLIVRNIIAMFGIENGIAAAQQLGDCMCFADSACANQTAPCTIGGPGTPVDKTAACGVTLPTMDESLLFLEAFGQH